MITMTVVPMSLNQVTSSGARPGTNQCGFLPAQQSAGEQTCADSDKRSLGSAVVNAVVTAS